ncbi:endonuclease NucS, partial [bacterium]|nr:endonuclease NucS [bacterium]
DCTDRLETGYRSFNDAFIPEFLDRNPGKSRIAAGLAGGQLWTVCDGMAVGDVLISPDGKGAYSIGHVVGSYRYSPGDELPHQRPVEWLQRGVPASSLSDNIRRSMGYAGTICELADHGRELDDLIEGQNPSIIKAASHDDVEDPVAFVMESHLEEFLVENWQRTEFGCTYDLYAENGELAGKQYQTDTGPLDLLAISKDQKRLLIIELKRGRASDAVVGQILRYMGYVKEVLAEPGQTVEGAIVALDDDLRIRRALTMTDGIKFYRYRIDFRLEEA